MQFLGATYYVVPTPTGEAHRDSTVLFFRRDRRTVPKTEELYSAKAEVEITH